MESLKEPPEFKAKLVLLVHNLFCDYPWPFGSTPRFVRFSILVILWMKADITDNTIFFTNLSLTLQLLPRRHRLLNFANVFSSGDAELFDTMIQEELHAVESYYRMKEKEILALFKVKIVLGRGTAGRYVNFEITCPLLPNDS